MECLSCSKSFLPRTSIQKFCCKRCNTAYRMIALGICRVDDCGERAVTVSEKLCHFHRRRQEAGFDLTNKRLIRQRGLGTLDKRQYVVIRIGGVAKFEHRNIVEKALGKPIPQGVQIHHLNDKKWDNRPNNLVVCPNDAYHKLLHKRTRELGIVFE